MNADEILSATPRTTLHRLRERGRTDRADLEAVLEAGLVCHLGVVIDGAPVVLPTGYGWLDDTLYLHGSSANRSLLAAAGAQVCVTITLLDGLVCARAVFHHSMNYRSAVIFGEGRLVSDPAEKLAALRAVTDHLVPGRWAHVREPDRKELAATAVVALPLTEASVKVRTGPPKDDDGGLRLRHLGRSTARRSHLRPGRAGPGAACRCARSRSHRGARRSGPRRRRRRQPLSPAWPRARPGSPRLNQ